MIAFILFSGLYCLKIGIDELAGALFAISLFQPSSTGLFLLFVFFWLIKNRRWRVLWGGLILLAFLLIASFALLPGWFVPFVRAVKLEFPFMNYLSSYKLFSQLWPAIGTKLAVILTLIVVILMIFEWRMVPKGNFRWFLWTATLTLILTSLSGIPTKLMNNQILWIPFSFFLANLIERAEGEKPLIKSGVFLSFISIGIWLIVISFLRLNNDMTFGLFFLFVPPILLLASHYWIRWWAIHPHRTALENIEHELN